MKFLSLVAVASFLSLFSSGQLLAQDSELFSGCCPNVAGGGRALVMPGYNFAGLGNRGMSRLPTNELDAIAYRHDFCERVNYVNSGKSASIACDQAFIDEANDLIRSTSPSRMRFQARNFRAFMSVRQSFLKQ